MTTRANACDPPKADIRFDGPAEELTLELECADIGGGVLPHWHRGGGELDPSSAPLVDEQFERLLANAKREPWQPQGKANGASVKAVLD